MNFADSPSAKKFKSDGSTVNVPLLYVVGLISVPGSPSDDISGVPLVRFIVDSVLPSASVAPSSRLIV